MELKHQPRLCNPLLFPFVLRAIFVDPRFTLPGRIDQKRAERPLLITSLPCKRKSDQSSDVWFSKDRAAPLT
jgi:hypothetical protein